MAQYRIQQWGPTTTITAIGDKPFMSQWHGGGDTQLRPTAHVTYDHPRETVKHPDATEGAGQFFRSHPGHVSMLFSDKRIAAHVPTLLGLAAQVHRNQTGDSHSLPMPDESLSDHSSRIVQHVQKMGVQLPTNPANPENKGWNGIDKGEHGVMADSSESRLQESFGDRLSDESVQGGRNRMRNIMRSSKLNANQFHQPEGQQQELF